jgi:hypothetical protein
MESGDIEIIIQYRPDFVFWNQHKEFRFITIRDAHGFLKWYPKPISER